MSPEADNNTIQAEENALTPELSSSDKSLIPATPTPEPGEVTPTLSGDTGTEASREETPAPRETVTPAASAQIETNNDGKTTPPWLQRRIDKVVLEKHEARREVEALKTREAALLATLAELRNGGQTPNLAPVAEGGQPAIIPIPAPAPKPMAAMPEAEIEARAQAKATEIAARNAFNKACNDIADSGKTEFTDFQSAIDNFNLLGGIPNQMLETLVELPNAHKVYYSIGKDPELAEKLMKLPPVKMAMELARIEQNLDKPSQPKPISTAPKPITPIETGGRAEENPEKMDTAAWIAWRNKTKKSRW